MAAYSDLALSRLTWPSGLVRERSATAVACLMSDEGGAMEGSYLRWLASQRLESTTVIGFLVLVRMLQVGRGRGLPTFRAVAAAQARPSILSRFLCRIVYGEACGAPARYICYSDAASHGESLPEFFEKYVRDFLPPIHFERARYIERTCRCAFLRQWAFEWQQLVDESNAPMSVEPLREWMRGAREGHYRPVVVDTWMSEIYRSSYLRALHWVLSEGRLSFDVAIVLAGEVCPVGLLLWPCKPNARPPWWPSVSVESGGTLDVAPASIFGAVEALWNRQRQRGLWDGEEELGTRCVLGAARGIVVETTVKYYLEIAGVFQRAVGPEAPSIESVGVWVFGEGLRRGAGPAIGPLEREARVELGDLEFNSVDDWQVAPAIASRGYTSRWQYWRMEGVSLPAEGFAGEALSLEVGDQSVIQRGASGYAYGRWWDWTDGVREEIVDTVPPRSGQVLSLDRARVEEMEEATGSTFCWVCRLTMYDQPRSYGAHRETRVYQLLGGSQVVRSSAFDASPPGRR